MTRLYVQIDVFLFLKYILKALLVRFKGMRNIPVRFIYFDMTHGRSYFNEHQLQSNIIIKKMNFSVFGKDL